MGCLKAESKLILHPYSFYLSVWIRPHLLDSIFFSTFLVNYCGFLNISWKRGIFNYFFFKKSCLSFKKDSPSATSVLCVCVYIYCCTYSCSMRQFSWATLPVNKISFFIFGFPYSVVLVLIIVVQMGVVNITKNTTMICAPLMAQSVEQVLSNMYQAKAEGADVVEIRLDCINNFQPGKDLEIILTKKPLPVLIVYR